MALDTANALTSLNKAREYLGYGIAAAQVTDVECVGNAAGSLSGKYFLISSTTVDYYVWYDISDGSADPAVSGRTGIEINIAGNKPAASVATSTKAVIDALAAFGATTSGPFVTITNAVSGEVSQPVDGDTGFNIVVQTVGATGDSSHDTEVGDHINRASWYLNTMTGRLLLSRTLTEHYDGDGTDMLIVNQYPVTTITSINIDSGRDYAAGTVVDSGDYMKYGDSGMIAFDGVTLTPGRQSIKIVYVAGYIVIPHDIEMACLQILAIDHMREDKNAFGISSRTDELGGSITFTQEDVLVNNVIAKYKRKYR